MYSATASWPFRIGSSSARSPSPYRGRKISQARIVVLTRQRFRNILVAIRESDGRADSQAKAKPGVDFVELLAYSGCRWHEAASLRWRDVDFAKGALVVSGGERGTIRDGTYGFCAETGACLTA